ncbi:MAG: hypothetical protein Q9226_001338 [Calogaya cf. arnoldii]
MLLSLLESAPLHYLADVSFAVCHFALEILYGQKWSWLVLLLLVAQFDKILKSYVIRRPANVKIAGAPTVIGHWLTSLRFLLVAIGTVKEGHKKARGKLFAVPALNKYTICVTSREQVEEVSNAPIDQLSFNAAIDEQFMPHLIFNGFRFDPKDPRYSIPLHAMKVQLKSNLQALVPVLKSYTADAFRDEFPEQVADNEKWTTFHPHMVSSRLVQRLNNVIIVGQDLTDDPIYLAASMQYTRDVVITGELLRFTPSTLQNAIGWISMNRTGAKNIVDSKVTAMMWDRINDHQGHGRKQCDLVQWMLDSTRKKSPQAITKLVQHVMGLLFGGAHQLPMLISFALYNLCKYPEYLEPLRCEIEKTANNEDDNDNYDNMPLMDSFLKETARVYPTVILTMPRKVLWPFKFADGTVVPKDNWIVVPSQALMQDEQYYEEPERFNGFRFVGQDGGTASSSQFSTPSFEFPFWGGTKRPCPGRFYVAVAAKMILSRYIADYDIRLENPKAAASLAWSYALAPHPRTKMLLRKRSDGVSQL